MRDSEALGVNPHCRCAFGLVTARRAVATEWTPSAALVADGAEDSDASSGSTTLGLKTSASENRIKRTVSDKVLVPCHCGEVGGAAAGGGPSRY